MSDDVLKGMSPNLGRGIAAFYDLSSVCCLSVVGKTTKFLSVVVGIIAAGCTRNSNKANLGRAMRQKAHLPRLEEAFLPSNPFSSVCCS